MSSTSFEGADDVVLPFAVEPLDVRGRVVRLGESIDTILARHRYPDAVARALGEAAALTVLLGSSLKFEGRFQLQTKSDGPVEMIVVDYDAPDRLRATARFDRDKVEALVRKVPGVSSVDSKITLETTAAKAKPRPVAKESARVEKSEKAK